MERLKASDSKITYLKNSTHSPALKSEGSGSTVNDEMERELCHIAAIVTFFIGGVVAMIQMKYLNFIKPPLKKTGCVGTNIASYFNRHSSSIAHLFINYTFCNSSVGAA